MRFLTPLALCVFIGIACTTARADNEIAAEPSTVTPGQTVTLKWYFTGDKVILSGGRFGQGTVVTGRQQITDKPTKTTRYIFDVTYHGLAPDSEGKQVRKQLHAHYNVVVEVFRMPSMHAYHASCGWLVNYVDGWQHVTIPTADMKKDGLVFFQPEEDSVERLAVAAMPTKAMTAEDLMQKVEADMPSHYNQVQVLSHNAITYRNIPAVLTTFSGEDTAHPGTRTQSLILAFVQGDYGYVISARTEAARYKARQPILERMLRSFVPTQTTSSR